MALSLGRNALQFNLFAQRSQKAISKTTPTTFVGGDPKIAKALKDAQRGKLNGARLLSSIPGRTVVMTEKQVGTLDLQAFRKASKPNSQPPVGNPLAPQRPLQAAPPQGAAVVPANQPAPKQELGVKEQLDKSANDLKEKVDTWLTAANAPPSRRQTGAHNAIYLQSAASQAIRTARAAYDRLEGQAQGDKQVLEQIRVAKRDAMVATLRMAIPTFADDAVGELADRLLTLDALMKRGAQTTDDKTYQIEKFIPILLAGAESYAKSPVSEHRSAAIACMTAQADAIIRACSPPRDGSELWPLVGQNAELAAAIKGARIVATQALMTDSYVKANNGQPPDPMAQAQIKKHAEEVVASATAAAKIRLQLAQFTSAQGGGTSAGILDKKLDAALIAGLREKCGKDTKQFSLILAGLLLAENTALTSTGSQRLLSDVEQQLTSRRQELARLREDKETAFPTNRQPALPRDETPDLALLNETIREEQSHITFLERKRDVLMTEGAVASARQTESHAAIEQYSQEIDALTGQMTRLRERYAALSPQTPGNQPERDSINQTLQLLTTENGQLHQKLSMAQDQNTYWTTRRLDHDAVTVHEQRWDRASKEESAAKRDLSERTADKDSLRNQIIENNKAKRPLGDLTTRLASAEKAVAAAQTRVDAASKETKALREQERSLQGRYTGVSLTGGLTTEDLKKLGLGEAQSQEILETVSGLVRMGLRSAEETDRVMNDVNAVLSRFNSGRSAVNDAISDQVNAFGNSTNENKVKNLANALLQRATGQPAMVWDQNNQTKIRDALVGADGQSGVLGPILAMNRNDPNSDALKATQDYEGAQRALAVLTDGLGVLDETAAAMRKRIETFNENARANGHRARDLEHPAGLAVSSNLREAVDLWNTHKGRMAEAPQAVRDRFLTLQKALAGFDPNTISVPMVQLGRSRLTDDKIREFSENKQLMETAEAIVLLRRDLPALRQEYETAIGETAVELDAAYVARQQAMEGEQKNWPALRDTMRAAVVSVLIKNGATVRNFQPSDHIKDIKTTLDSWGVPPDDNRIAPELSRLLGQSFGPAELEQWFAEARPTDALAQTQEQERTAQIDAMRAKSNAGGRTASSKGGISPQAKVELLNAFDKIQLGTKVKLTVGDRVEVQTGNIPLSPVRMNAKVAVGKMAGIEIARVIDGYELYLRDGWDGKAGLEASVKLPGSGINVGADVKTDVSASLGLDASGLRVAGVVIKTPVTPAGLAAMKDILESLLTEQKIQPKHLARAENLMPLLEQKIAGKLTAGVKAGLDYKAPDPIGLAPGVNAAAKIGVGVGISETRSTMSNTNVTVRKREQDRFIEVSASAGVSFGMGVGIANQTGSTQTASTEMLGVQGTTTLSYKQKSKEVRGGDGLVQAGTEMALQLQVPAVGRERFVNWIGGKVWTAVINNTFHEGQEPSVNDEQRSAISDFIKASNTGDIINLLFSLDERVRTAVNNKLIEAKALRNQRSFGTDQGTREARAAALEQEAQDLLDTIESYVPFKFQLIPTTETMQSNALPMTPFVTWSTYTEGRSEIIAADVKFDTTIGMKARERLAQQPH